MPFVCDYGGPIEMNSVTYLPVKGDYWALWCSQWTINSTGWGCCGFCTLLFCLVVNELHQIQWPQKPLTMDTSDEMHDANIYTLSTRAQDATLAEALKWKKSSSSIIRDYQMQFNKIKMLHIWKAFYPNPKDHCQAESLQRLWPSCIDFTKPGKCFACRHSLLDLSLASEAQ